MNDNELITLVRESVAGVHSTTPVAQIISRGRAVRTRRRLGGSAGLAVAGVAVGSALVVGLTGVLGASPHQSTGATRATQSTGTIRTVGFILTANTNGTLTLTMSQMLDPAALQQALAQHGIAALVKTNTYCTSDPAPAGDGVLSVNPPVQPKPGFVPAPSGFADGPQVLQPGHPDKVFPPDAHTQTVINPAAMPAGTELFFGYAPGDNVVFEDLIYAHSYACGSQPPYRDGPQVPRKIATG
jgi:hypothetical protein